jgi:hypothetical protein
MNVSMIEAKFQSEQIFAMLLIGRRMIRECPSYSADSVNDNHSVC